MASDPMRTEAEILVALGEPLSRTTLKIPPLKQGQVLVEVAFSGVCHTQLNEARGRRGPDAHLPHTLGHEGSGIVREIGAGVTKVAPGDHVVLTWIRGRGLDAPATAYESDRGKVNSGAISTFMRTTVASENRLVKIPEAMPLREAALLGCAIPTGAGVVLNAAKLQSGESIAIVGVGGIGLSAILGALSAGAARIFAVDLSADKLKRARDLGATDSIDASRELVVERILELTDGRGVDCAIEAAGSRAAMESAFKSVRIGGGRCIIAGNLPNEETIAINPMDLIRGKRISGTWGGETQPDVDIPRYTTMYLESKLPMHQLITHEYTFGNINQALDDLERGAIGRAVVSMR